ncbi:MAG: hypothetical protein FWC25_02470 [Dehalococcoidia bacterium]|nr:hypothetical protein [Dehalococcoidia bacterium]
MATGGFNYDSSIGASVDWVRLALFVILIVILTSSFTKNMKAIHNLDRLNKLQITEEDERNLFIKQKTGFLGMDIVLFGLTIATLFSRSSGPKTFFTFFWSLLFVSAVRVSLIMYYRNKY